MGYASRGADLDPTIVEHLLPTFLADIVYTTITTANSLEILIQTGAAPVHPSLIAQVSGDFDTEFYEGTTFSAAGTAVPAASVDRTQLDTPLTTITQGPTLSADGSQLAGSVILGGSDKQAFKNPGGSGGNGVRWKLAANSDYLIRFTNNTGGDQNIAISLGWQETTD